MPPSALTVRRRSSLTAFTKDLILLNMVQDMGFIRLKALLAEFEIPKAIFNASIPELKRVKGIGPKIAESIKSAREDFDIDKEISLIEKNGITIKTVFEKDYPGNLKEIYDPPMVLYIKGEVKELDNLAVSIVGSRRASLYGIRTAERLAEGLVTNGVTVVSGMARGIDTAAHRGAVRAKGRTIAVLGNGLASIYPPENKKLSEEIVRDGALVSEFPMEMPPHKENFPRRNRVISGLSKAVVVVEAAKKSGALITADFALEQGKDVFAVPGTAGSLTSSGTNNLIKEGAKLVEDTKDILEELGIDFKDRKPKETQLQLSNALERNIFNLLSDRPCHIDDVIEKLSIDAKKMRLGLLNLEMKGIIKQLPGKLYVRA